MSEQVAVKVNKIEVSPVTGTSKYGPGRCAICGKPVIKPAVTLEDGTGEGSTCVEHIGKLRQHANTASVAPEGWLKMSAVCRFYEGKGFKTSEIVKFCGGDATTEPVLDELFRPTYVGNRKYLHPDVLTVGLEMALKSKAAPVKAEVKDKPASKPAQGVAGVLKQAVAKKS